MSPPDLCISTDASTKRWGSKFQGISTGHRKTEGSHQHTRAEGSAFSHIDFCKIQNSSEDTCPDGQQSSFELPSKDEGYSQQGPSWSLQKNMCLSAVEKDHNYCRVPTRSSECDSRVGVPQFSGQDRLETFLGSI